MFSFFKKKQPFSVRIKEYGSVRLIAGMEITTCRKSMKKDVSQLQKKVQQHQSELRELSNPSGTMVISTTPDETGNFSYFLGAWVDIEEQEPPWSTLFNQNKFILKRTGNLWTLFRKFTTFIPK